MTFNREIKKGSMREVTSGIFKILRTDEELMRLLWYPSEDIGKEVPHPMEHPDNIVVDIDEVADADAETYWDRVDKAIKLTEKVSDIEEDAMCRLYIYPGRRRSVFNNYLQAEQEITIDVFVHESYSADMRIEWINDRVCELLSLEHIKGALGAVDYVGGQGWQAPIGYSKYQHRFVFRTGKK